MQDVGPQREGDAVVAGTVRPGVGSGLFIINGDPGEPCAFRIRHHAGDDRRRAGIAFPFPADFIDFVAVSGLDVLLLRGRPAGLGQEIAGRELLAGAYDGSDGQGGRYAFPAGRMPVPEQGRDAARLPVQFGGEELQGGAQVLRIRRPAPEEFSDLALLLRMQLPVGTEIAEPDEGAVDEEVEFFLVGEVGDDVGAVVRIGKADHFPVLFTGVALKLLFHAAEQRLGAVVQQLVKPRKRLCDTEIPEIDEEMALAGEPDDLVPVGIDGRILAPGPDGQLVREGVDVQQDVFIPSAVVKDVAGRVFRIVVPEIVPVIKEGVGSDQFSTENHGTRVAGALLCACKWEDKDQRRQ